MGRRRHTPLGGAVLVHHRQAGLHHIGGEGGVPENLLGNMALGRDRPRFTKHHARGLRRGILLQPFDGFGNRVNRGRVVGGAATRHTGPDRARVIIDPHSPFIHRQPIGLALVPHAGHRHPGVGITPAQGRVFLTVIHVAKHPGRATQVAHIPTREERRNVLIGGPVHRHTQVVTVFGLEVFFGFGVAEPVSTKPVQVGELLIGQLIQLAVRGRGETVADEILKVQGRAGHGSTLTHHEIAQISDLLIAPVGTNQIGIIHIGVVDVLPGLHLQLQLFHHITFANQVVGHLDAGNAGEGRCQNLGFVFVGGQGLGCHFDGHA